MVLLAPGVVPALPADGFLSLHLPDRFICLPLSPFIWPRLSPSLDACHGSLGGQIRLSPCVSLHLSPVVSPPGCLARLSGWTGSFVSLCLPSFVSRCLPAWMPGTALWVDGFICLPVSPFICLPLSPRLDAWHGSLGGRSPCVSLHLSPVVSPPPAWMPGTALWVDAFVCLPVSPFICLPLSPRLDAWHGSLGGRVHLSPCVSLHLSPVVSPPGCLARLSGWTGSFDLPVSPFICLPLSPRLDAFWVDGFICLPVSPFICLPLSPRLDAWHGSLGGRSPCVSLHLSPVVSPPPAWMPGTALWVDAFVCLPVSPFICLPLSPRLDAWHGSLGGRVHLSPCVSLHLSPVVSPPGCLARLSGWTGSFVSLCLPSFVSRCLPAWMRLARLSGWTWFICLLVSPFICLPLSPRLDAWHGSLAGRVRLSPCVSLHLSPVDAWHGSLGGRVRLSFWVHLSPFVSLHLAPVVSHLGSWWVVFRVHRWLHPVCSFSALLSVAVPS